MGNLTHTVSGDIASFRSASRVPIESLKCHFLPIQEGEGDPSPDNIRSINGWNNINVYNTGKNIGHIVSYSSGTLNKPTDTPFTTGYYGNTLNTTLPASSVTITQTQWPETNNVTSYKNGYFCIQYDNLQFGQTYSLSFKITNITNNPLNVSLSSLRIANPKGNRYVPTILNDNIILFNNFKFEQNTNRPQESDIAIYNCGISCTFSEFMITPTGMNDGIWEPYCGNIIPITFPNIGKNKINMEEITFTTSKSYEFNPPLPPGTYTFSAIINTNDTDDITNCISFNTDGDGTKYLAVGRNTRKSKSFTSAKNIKKMWLYAANDYTTSIGDQATYTNIQLELGSTMTDYEPYNDNNTIYGGYVDIAKGELVQTWDVINLGELTWTTASNNDITWFRAWKQMPNTWHPDVSSSQDNSYAAHIISDRLKTDAAANIYWDTAEDNSIAVEWTTPRSIRLKSTKYNLDTEDLTVDLQNVLLYYELETPIHYPLLKQELMTYLDQNNIWSNTNDITEISYQIHDSNLIKERKMITMGENATHYQKIIWNQINKSIADNGWVPYISDGINDRITVTFNNDIAECEYINLTSAGYSASLRNNPYPDVNTDSLYYGSYMIYPEYSGRFGLEFAGGAQITDEYYSLKNTWTHHSFIAQGRRNASGAMYIPYPWLQSCSLGDKFKIKNPVYINLTQMFGKGKEPTLREFESLCKYNNIDLKEFHAQNLIGTPKTLILPKRKKVIWNQIAAYPSLNNYQPYNSSNTLTEENGELIITYGVKYNDYRNCIKDKSQAYYYQNHKYYVKQDFCPSWNSTLLGVSICNYAGVNYPTATANEYISNSYIREKLTNNGTHNILLAYPYYENNLSVGDTCKIRNIILVDLTLMFGAGNEPNTPEEFEAICEKNCVDLSHFWTQNRNGIEEMWIL